jgi:hypothetical protein
MGEEHEEEQGGPGGYDADSGQGASEGPAAGASEEGTA